MQKHLLHCHYIEYDHLDTNKSSTIDWRLELVKYNLIDGGLQFSQVEMIGGAWICHTELHLLAQLRNS